jgi:hypothetical protein
VATLKSLRRKLKGLRVHRRKDTRRIKNLAPRVKRLARRLAEDRLWGGSRYYTNRAIAIVGDRAPVTSRKRVATFGNPGSDHHVSATVADAVDFGTVENHALKNELSRKLGGPNTIADYGTFTTRRNGRTYRHQLIAGTHGTGPHLHYGVRRV